MPVFGDYAGVRNFARWLRARNYFFGVCVLVLFVTFRFVHQQINWPLNTFVSTDVPLSESKESSLLENECMIPWLFADEPDLKDWIPPFGPISCTKQMANLAYLDEDYVKIQRDLDSKWDFGNSPIICKLFALEGGLKPTIGTVKLVPLNITLRVGDQYPIPVDQFVVECHNESNKEKVYSRAFAGFANQKKKKELAPLATETEPSLVLLILDSTSRNQFVRHAPRSFEYMKQLGFVFSNGYTKVGDNSGVNLFPVLAGRSTESRINGIGKELVSELPVRAETIEWLWNLMKKKKCVTAFNDDIMNANRGLFAYHHFNGFERPPTDYFFRPFSLFNVKTNEGQCTIHGQSLVEQHLGLFEQFSRVFKDHCHFSVNFLTTATHDHAAQLQVEDEAIRSILEKFFAIGVLNNTAVVIAGDHGNRIGGIQYSFTGRIEERMPLFALYLPPGLRKKYSDYWSNLRYNSNRLTSNFDVYKTLRTLALLGQKQPKPKFNYRGYSLLTDRVPRNRTCADAAIPPNFCICLEQKSLPTYKRGKNEFNRIEIFLRDVFTKSPHSCLLGHSLVIVDDQVRSFSVNPMVRQGWRDMNTDQKLNNDTHMEVVYHDLRFHATSVYDERLQLHVQLTRYVTNGTLRVPHWPVIVGIQSLKPADEEQNDDKPISLSLYAYCSQ